MKAKPDISDLFQKSNRNLDEMPPAHIWNRLEQRLDRRHTRLMIYRRLAGAAAVLVLAVSAFLAALYLDRPAPEPVAAAVEEDFRLSPLPVNQSPQNALEQVRLSRRIYRNLSPSDQLAEEGGANLASLSDALRPSTSSSGTVANALPGQLAFADQQAQKLAKERKRSPGLDSAEADSAPARLLKDEAPRLESVALGELVEEQKESAFPDFENETAPSSAAMEEVQMRAEEDLSRLNAVTTDLERAAKKTTASKEVSLPAFSGLEGNWSSPAHTTAYQQSLELSRKTDEKVTGKLTLTTEEGKEKYKFTLIAKDGVETLEVSGKGAYRLKQKANGNWIFENNSLSPAIIYFQKSGGQMPAKENEWRLEKVEGRR
jgi:hypothetical protein